MTDKKLIQALREDAEWAEANEWETPITLSNNLTKAADRLEALLAENDRLWDSARRLWAGMPRYCGDLPRFAMHADELPSTEEGTQCSNAPTKWVSVEERLPESNDKCVLTVVNGIYGGIHFYDAIEIAEFVLDEGWILESYPDWENPNVTYWCKLPEPPSTEGVE